MQANSLQISKKNSFYGGVKKVSGKKNFTRLYNPAMIDIRLEIGQFDALLFLKAKHSFEWKKV